MINNKALVEKVKQELKKNGIALVKSYMSDSKELLELKRKIYHLVCIKAEQYNIDLPSNNPNSINNSIIELHVKK